MVVAVHILNTRQLAVGMAERLILCSQYKVPIVLKSEDKIVGPSSKGTGRDRFIYKIMSQDVGTAMTYCIEKFGVDILCQGSKVQEGRWQVSTSTHPGD